MAVYKVIQNIEADDKLLGPLSLKQFIYAAIAGICILINFQLITKTGGPVRIIGLLIFIWPTLLFGLLASPLGGDQPTEVWVLARLRFYLKPRRRIWDQSGMKELVTITVPKKIERQYTDGLSQTEVRSRLNALATTLDSRGWAIKNVSVNMYNEPGYLSGNEGESDRLVGTATLPQDNIASDIKAEDDILDENSNATAQHVDKLIKESTAQNHQEILQNFDKVRGKQVNATEQPDYWFMNQPDPEPQKKHHGRKKQDRPKAPSSLGGQPLYNFGDTTVTPGSAQTDQAADDPELTEQIRHSIDAQKRTDHEAQAHLKHVLPLSEQKIMAEWLEAAQKAKAEQMTPEQRTAILEGLAQNEVFSVQTLGKEANRKLQKPKEDDGEVVISLHDH